MSDLRRPRALVPGDAVAVVAPASPFDSAEFDAGIAELTALGFAPEWQDDVFARRGYVAGEAPRRAADFLRAWQAPHVAAVIGARGGYGSVQMLDHLHPGTVRDTPKAFVGYSDLTTLLTWLVCRCGVVAFHGPTVAGRLGRGTAGYDRQSFLAALTVGAPMGEIAPGGLEVVKGGEAHGRLMGGTLTQLAAACGTPDALDPWDDTILLLEDVGERPYRLDRLVEQIRRAGVLRHVRAIVLGTFPRCDEPGGAVTARAALADVFRDFPGPVVFGMPFGHVDGPAVTLPLGVRARLVALETPRLVIEEAAVVS